MSLTPLWTAVQALAPLLVAAACILLGALILDWCLHTPLRRDPDD